MSDGAILGGEADAEASLAEVVERELRVGGVIRLSCDGRVVSL